jgi:hypothetical protein
MNPPTLFLIRGTQTVVLGRRDVALGRLPECDLVLDGWEVSRRHARVVPTPAGPVLVDRSRFGTFVNNLQVVGPLLLADGDVIRIGATEVRVASSPAAGFVMRADTSPPSRLAAWWRRYAPSEIAGALAAIVGALGALRLGAAPILAAVVASIAEAVWFYVALGLRDLRYEAKEQRAAGRSFDRHAATDVLRNLLREFGAAEGIDLVVRSLCIWGGLAALGGIPGVLAGKLVADLLFYGPVLARWHWRLARRSLKEAEPQRLRNTMAVEPLSRLAELHLRLEAESAHRPEIPSPNASDR